MKTYKIPLLSTAALALGAALLLTPNTRAVDEKTKLSSADERFIQDEAAAGIALVQIAELGEKKANRADIKAFAGLIAADHAKANIELATLATSKSVELHSEVDSKHTDTFEKLEGESTRDFDKEFLSVIVSAHKKCVKNFEDAAEDSEDSDVKSWATGMLPALRAHLEKAEDLKSAPTTKTGAASDGVAATEPDNTARNMRDRNASTLTPLDQGNSQTDIDTTANIRKGILSLEDISVNARNVKIITNEGHVTLRGPVNTEEEKRLIGEIANRIALSEHADNQLEVRGVEAAN